MNVSVENSFQMSEFVPFVTFVSVGRIDVELHFTAFIVAAWRVIAVKIIVVILLVAISISFVPQDKI